MTIAVNRNLSNCENSTKKKVFFGASTGFEPVASALALQCSPSWAMKTHILEAGQFIEFINPWKGWWTHHFIQWTSLHSKKARLFKIVLRPYYNESRFLGYHTFSNQKWRCHHSSFNRNCKLAQRKDFRGFNGIRTCVLCVSSRRGALPAELWRPIHWRQANLFSSSRLVKGMKRKMRWSKVSASKWAFVQSFSEKKQYHYLKNGSV